MNKTPPNEFDYGLINPLQTEVNSVFSDSARSIAPQALAQSAKHLPWLLPLRPLTRAQRAELGAFAAGTSYGASSRLFCALFSSDADPATMVAHLKRRLILRDQTGRPCLLRFYDPRVFAHLRWILQPAQLQRLLGPVSAWAYWLAGGWNTAHFEAADADPGPPIGSEQRAQISRIGLINQVQAAAGSASVSDTSMAGRQIADLLEHSQNLGLMQADDQIAFALHGLERHHRFHEHPRLMSLIKNAGGGGSSYALATRSLQVADWQKIVSELDQKPEVGHDSRSL